MLVSIIIPVYNVALYIERCLISVFNQTYTNIEVILVDDCSPDNSIDIAKSVIDKFTKQNSVHIIKHKKNRGLSAARNTGINKSKGDYLYFLDSDDDIPFSSIDNLVKYASDCHPDFAIGNVLQIYPDKKKVIDILCSDIYIDSNKAILNAFLKNEWYVMAWNKLVNREFLIKNKLFFKEGILHEDNLWSYQLAFKAHSMSICHEITYNYYINKGSITSNIKQRNIDDMVSSLAIMSENVFQRDSLTNLLCLQYLETIRFDLLLLPSDRKSWMTNFEKLQNLSYTSRNVLNSELPKRFKIKRVFEYLPKSLIYPFFLFLKQIFRANQN